MHCLLITEQGCAAGIPGCSWVLYPLHPGTVPTRKCFSLWHKRACIHNTSACVSQDTEWAPNNVHMHKCIKPLCCTSPYWIQTHKMIPRISRKQHFLVKEFSESESCCFSSSTWTKAFSPGLSDSETLSFRPYVDNILPNQHAKKIKPEDKHKETSYVFSVCLQLLQWEDLLQRRVSVSEEIWTPSGVSA